MKMEGNENKEEAGKGIPRLIESLKGKQINEKSPGGGRERKVQKPSKNDSVGKGKGQHSSVNKNEGKGKGQTQTKGKGKTSGKGKGKHMQRQSMISIKDHVSSRLGRKTMRRKTWRLSMRERRSLNRSRTSVVRRFTEIMKDARVRDWKNMAHFSNLRHSVQMFDHESKSARNPGLEIEWPIVWLLSAFHRKHIFVPQKMLETKHINNVAIRLKRRVGWAWALRRDSTVRFEQSGRR